MTTFIIQENIFAYSGEYFYIKGRRIHQTFRNRAQAEHMYRQLEINAARYFQLNEIKSFFEAKPTELKKYNDFVYSCCGKHIVKNGVVLADFLPENLSDEDTFRLIKLAKMQAYHLVEYQDGIQFYSLWLTQKQGWLKLFNEGTEGLVYVESEKLLQYYMQHIFNLQENSDILFHGKLTDISDYPVLLQNFITTLPGLTYENQTLTIKLWDDEALFIVNPLLKKPLFEVRKISLIDVLKIENKWNDQGFYDVA